MRTDSEQGRKSPKLVPTQEAGSGSDSETKAKRLDMVAMKAMMVAMMVMRGSLPCCEMRWMVAMKAHMHANNQSAAPAQ